MSYSLRLAGDAAADLRTIDPSLGEQVLDELEILANEPGRLRFDSAGEATYDFSRELAGIEHLVSSGCFLISLISG